MNRGTIARKAGATDIFEIHHIERQGQAVLVLAGDLDISTSRRLLEAARPLVGRFRDLVIDLSRLGFVDSSGLEALWILREEAHAVGRELLLIPGRDHVHRVFELTGLDATFRFVDEAALR